MLVHTMKAHSRTRDITSFFSGAFTKFQEASVIFDTSIHLSIHMEQLGSHRMDFNEIWYLSIFKSLSRQFKFHLNLTRKTDTLHEDQYTFLIISCSVLLRMRNVSDKICGENRNIHFMSNNFLKKSCLLWDNVKILYSLTGHRWKNGACASHAGCLRLQTHTQNM